MLLWKPPANHSAAAFPALRIAIPASLSFLSAASGPPPIISSYNKSPTNIPITPPSSVPTTGMGMAVPNNSPRAVPSERKSALPRLPLLRNSVIPTISGPMIGILIPFAALDTPLNMFKALLGTLNPSLLTKPGLVLT